MINRIASSWITVALIALGGVARADQVKVVAYEPLSPSLPKSGAVVLEFAPAFGPDTWVAKVEDMNGVVTSSIGYFLVPSNSTYRARIPLELAPGGDFSRGVNLRVGLGPNSGQLVFSSSLYAGPADKCFGAGCGTTSPSSTAVLAGPGVNSLDSSIAVGDQYAMVSDVNDFLLFQKQFGPWVKQDLTSVPCGSTTCGSTCCRSPSNNLSCSSAPTCPGGTVVARTYLGWSPSETTDPILAPGLGDGRLNGATKLFREFWLDLGPKNYNVNFVLKKAPPAALAVMPCDPKNPMYQVVSPPPGVNVKKTNGQNYSWVTSSCISDIYDKSVRWDPHRKRFWIIAAGRSLILGNGQTGTCVGVSSNAPFNSDTCKAIDSMEYRPLFVAISRTQNPLDGFHTYQVADEDADQPVFEVTNDFAIFGHTNSAKVWVYDANDMAAGKVANPLGSPLPPQATLAGGAPPSEIGVNPGVFNIRAPRMRSALGGVSLVLVQGSQGDNKVQIQGISTEPLGRVGNLKVHGGTLFTDGDSLDISGDQVYQGGYLYITNDTVAAGGHWSAVIVRRIPVHLDSVTQTIIAETNLAAKWTFAGPGLSYNYPNLDITDDGNVVVGWRAVGNTVGAHLRYAVLYHGEERFRDVATLRPPSGLGDPGRTDFAHASLDPDGHTVWIVGGDNAGLLAGAVPVYDHPPPALHLVGGAKLVFSWVERCRDRQIVRIYTGNYLSGPDPLNVNSSGGVQVRSVSAPQPLKIVWACNQDKQTTSNACPAKTDILQIEHGKNGDEGRVDFYCYQSQPAAPAPDFPRPGVHLSTESDSCPLGQPVHLVKGTKTDGVDPITAPGQHAIYNLANKRFFWSCGSNQKWETCHDDTTLVVIERDASGNVIFDCRQIPAPPPQANAGARVGQPFTGGCNYDEVVHQVEGVLVGGVAELTNTSQFSLYRLNHPTSFKWRCGDNSPSSVSCPASANLVRITRGPGRNVNFDCRKQ